MSELVSRNSVFVQTSKYIGYEGVGLSRRMDTQEVQVDSFNQQEVRININSSTDNLRRALMAFAGNGGDYLSLFMITQNVCDTTPPRLANMIGDIPSDFGVGVDSSVIARIVKYTGDIMDRNPDNDGVRGDVVSFSKATANTWGLNANKLTIYSNGIKYSWQATDSNIPNGNILRAAESYARMVQNAEILGLNHECVMGASKRKEKKEQVIEGDREPANIKVMRRILDSKDQSNFLIEDFTTPNFDFNRAMYHLEHVQEFIPGIIVKEGDLVYASSEDLHAYLNILRDQKKVEDLIKGDTSFVECRSKEGIPWRVSGILEGHDAGEIITFDSLYDQMGDDVEPKHRFNKSIRQFMSNYPEIFELGADNKSLLLKKRVYRTTLVFDDPILDSEFNPTLATQFLMELAKLQDDTFYTLGQMRQKAIELGISDEKELQKFIRRFTHKDVKFKSVPESGERVTVKVTDIQRGLMKQYVGLWDNMVQDLRNKTTEGIWSKEELIERLLNDYSLDIDKLEELAAKNDDVYIEQDEYEIVGYRASLASVLIQVISRRLKSN